MQNNKKSAENDSNEANLVGKVLDMSQTCRKVGQMSKIFDSDVEVFDIK